MPLSTATAHALVVAKVADVAPTGTDGIWWVKARTLVGVAVIGDVVVRVRPKVDIRRLVALLAYTRDGQGWRTDEVGLERSDGLVEAVARVLLHHTDTVVRHGLLQGYRGTDDTLPVLRGRLREADQLRRRPGLPFPLEVRYDEWTVDIAENRVLKAAAGLLLKLPLRDTRLRSRLHRLVRGVLVDVADVPPQLLRGSWRASRLNARYRPALDVAELVLAGRSFEQPAGGVAALGFLLDLPKVFEDLVCGRLSAALLPHGGAVSLQHRCHLDLDRTVEIKPDLVWLRGERAVAVVDAKYKAEKPSGHPNADLYQLLAYCVTLRLREGHLVYARGNEEPAVYRVAGADVVVQAHALDLDQELPDVLAQLDALGQRLTAGV